ncbi:MAG TPA: CDP-alcohol phosphatidyltransferase family protein [Dermatophilaceae bacterium]|nr:CDP-alcohol phosphatidyltransferase family protein [Dermatophilaceae bacterium]
MTNSTTPPSVASQGLRLTVAEARRALAQAQKPPHGTPAYSRFVNRPLGRRLAAIAAVRGLTPNQVSALSALCSFTAIAVLALVAPAWWVGVVVSALLVLGYALDSADGQVARLTGAGSPFGEWLDHMIDCAKVSSLHLATAVHLVRFSGLDLAVALVPFGYLLAANVTFFGMMLTDQLRRAHGQNPMTKGGSLSVVRSLLILPSDYGFLCLGYLLLGWTTAFLVGYAAMALGAVLLLGAALVKWTRQMRALPAKGAAR